MSMTYVIGIDKITSDINEIMVNSSTDILLNDLLLYALNNNIDIYDKITEEVIFVRLDVLSKEEFLFLIHQINNLKNISTPSISTSLEVWDTYIYPLLQKDVRYD